MELIICKLNWILYNVLKAFVSVDLSGDRIVRPGSGGDGCKYSNEQVTLSSLNVGPKFVDAAAAQPTVVTMRQLIVPYCINDVVARRTCRDVDLVFVLHHPQLEGIAGHQTQFNIFLLYSLLVTYLHNASGVTNATSTKASHLTAIFAFPAWGTALAAVTITAFCIGVICRISFQFCVPKMHALRQERLF